MCPIANFLESNSIFIVLVISIIIWIGIFIYIYRLDKKVKNLEEKFKSKE